MNAENIVTLLLEAEEAVDLGMLRSLSMGAIGFGGFMKPGRTPRPGWHHEILARPPADWHMAPAFGAGCCSPGNSDRRVVIGKK